MQLNFNAFDYDPSQSGGICFPLGDYKVEITAAEPKVVKDNPSAGYLELSLTVTEGDLRGMVQRDRLNIFNPSEVAKRIANQRLSAYCFAINRPYVQDTAQLIGGRCIITAGPQDGEQSKYSEVKVVKCLDGTMPTRPANQQQAAPAAAPPPAPAPAAAPASAPPWGSAPPPAAAPAAPASAAAAPPWGMPPASAQQAAAAPSGAAVPPWAK